MSTATTEAATTTLKPKAPILNPNVPKTITVTLPQALFEVLQENSLENGVKVMRSSSRRSETLRESFARRLVSGDRNPETAIMYGIVELSQLMADAIADGLTTSAAAAVLVGNQSE